MKDYKDNTYFKYKERDKQRHKDLLDGEPTHGSKKAPTQKRK